MLIFHHALVALILLVKDTGVVLRVLLGLVVLRPMILTTLMVALLVMDILVASPEALHPKVEEIILPEMAESLVEVTGDLKIHFTLGNSDRLTGSHARCRINYTYRLSPGSSSRTLMFHFSVLY